MSITTIHQGNPAAANAGASDLYDTDVGETDRSSRAVGAGTMSADSASVPPAGSGAALAGVDTAQTHAVSIEGHRQALDEAIRRLGALIRDTGGAEGVGRILIESLNENQQAEKERGQLQSLNAEAALLDQADKLDDGASKTRDAAIVGSAVGFATSGLQLYGGVKGLSDAGKAAGAAGTGAGTAASGGPNAASGGNTATTSGAASKSSRLDTDIVLEQSRSRHTLLLGVTSLLNSGKESAQGVLSSQAEMDRADASRLAAHAQRHNASRDEQAASSQSLLQVAQTLLQYIKELNEAEVEAMHAITAKG